MTEDNLLESVSDTVHWIWANWMKHMFKKTQAGEMVVGEWLTNPTPLKYEAVEGIFFEDAERWKRQMLQSYYDLSEKEKESDRVLARQLIQNWTYNPFTGEKL